MNHRWEYEVRKIKPDWQSSSIADIPDVDEIIESFLNGMGEQGWEFVCFLPQISQTRSTIKSLDTSAYYAVFKKRMDQT